MPARHLNGKSAQPEEQPATRNTLRFIILGLLGARAMTGYDIKQAFDRAIASYWNAGNSQIYTTLKALEHDGLVESELVIQQHRPNRKLYRLTPQGEAELDAWLKEPAPERFTKDEFLARLFFCGQTTDEAALRHLMEHRQAIETQLTHMEWVRQHYTQRPARRPHLLEYQLLVREYKEETLRADLAVTERAIARLRERIEGRRPAEVSEGERKG
ncbi:MAG TPA: PadR family transcriptional regulator [Ktedonobacterales bacterium]|jgi:DNA-binding PadR family transcriptional regulator